MAPVTGLTMTDVFSPDIIYTAFALAASVETYFFMMQRAALNISRAVDIDAAEGRLMLPLWYALAWPAKLIKWGAAIYIGAQFSWATALGILAFVFVLHIAVPVPSRMFIWIFRRKLAREISTGEDARTYSRLYRLLFEVSKDSQFN